MLTVSTCNAADYDTDLVLYEGCDCGDLLLLDCDDDSVGCAGFTSRVVASVFTGSCYKVRVGGFGPNDFGSGNLTITCQP